MPALARKTATSSVASILAATTILATTVVAAGGVEPTLPRPKGYVSDYVGVLDRDTQLRLENLISELDRKTGAQIAVIVVRSTKPLTAFDYAMKIAEAWRPGDRRKDNGVVFLVATDDREMFILTGYGVEHILPDGKVGEIRDRLILPHFRRGDYAQGIWFGTLEIARIIARDAGVSLTSAAPDAGPAPAPAQPHAPRPLTWLDVVVILLVLVTLLAMATRFERFRGGRRWYYGGYRGGFGGGGFRGGGGFGGFGGGGFGGGGAGGRW